MKTGGAETDGAFLCLFSFCVFGIICCCGMEEFFIIFFHFGNFDIVLVVVDLLLFLHFLRTVLGFSN